VDAERTLLADLAYPFMPADPGRRSATVEAGPAWVLDLILATDARADHIVWGRLPDSASPLGAALQSAVAREVGLIRLRRRVPRPSTRCGPSAWPHHQPRPAARCEPDLPGALVELTR
jgi:hypothetical protein